MHHQQLDLPLTCFGDEFDFPHLEVIMPLVDDLDSGGISLDTFRKDGPPSTLSYFELQRFKLHASSSFVVSNFDFNGSNLRR